MARRFKPTPPAASALALRAIQLGHGQWSIENGPGTLGGEFDQYYVHLSGYCGEHNPWVFAAAPELLEALTSLERYLRNTPHHNALEAAAARKAIARATGDA